MLALENGIFNATTQTRMQELEMRRKDLEEQISIEKNKSNTQLTENETKKIFQRNTVFKNRAPNRITNKRNNFI